MEIERRLAVVRGSGGWGIGDLLLMGMEFLLGGMKLAKFALWWYFYKGVYTKIHYITHFTWIHSMACELYFNNAITNYVNENIAHKMFQY